MLKRVKRSAKLAAVSFFAVLLTGGLILIATESRADGETGDTSKPLFIPCSVQSGDHIIKIGDTCGSGGNGCSSNPCQ